MFIRHSAKIFHYRAPSKTPQLTEIISLCLYFALISLERVRAERKALPLKKHFANTPLCRPSASAKLLSPFREFFYHISRNAFC